MIKGSSTGSWWNNATLVELEDSGTGLDCDRNWLFGNSSHMSWRAVDSNCNITSGIDNTLAYIVFAGALIGGIWIRRLSHHFVWLQIVKAVGHQASTATNISIWSRTINYLLFREVIKSARFNLLDSFHCWNWGKCIARAATSLVFNRTYCPWLPPINRSRERKTCSEKSLFFLYSWFFIILFCKKWLFEPQHSFKFFRRQISKFI